MLAYLESQLRLARQDLAHCFWLLAALATILSGVFSSGVFTKRQAPAKRQFRPILQQATTLQGKAAVDYLMGEGIFDRLRASIEASNYDLAPAPQSRRSSTFAIKQRPEVYLAKNPAQNLTAQFSAAEVRLKSSQGEDKEAVLKLRGYGYGKSVVALSSGLTTVTGNRVEITRSTQEAHFSRSSGREHLKASRAQITEWYLNTKDGIEQGFTLERPPAVRPSDAPLRVTMIASGKVKVTPAKSGCAVELRTANGEPWLRYDHLVATDARGHELPARMEVLGREISLVVDDSAATYPVQIDPTFSQVTELTATDAASGDEFGYSIKISGDTAVVGAYQKNSSTGAAYIFERNQGGADNWGQVKELTASDAAQGDEFGREVAINGGTVIVGAPFKNSSTGAAYIFERNQGGAENWGQVSELTASDGAQGDQFGNQVAIDAGTVAIGAALKNSSTGAVYIFERSNQGGVENWGQVQELTASDGAPNDLFGISSAIFADTVVVGASGHSFGTGSVYVFSRNEGGAENWGQVQELTASDAAQGAGFGQAVGISGDTVVVGASGKNSSTGAAYVFQNECGQWSQTKEPVATDAAANDNFSISVGIDGDTAVVGAYAKNSFTGAAYNFERNQGGAENWGQVQKLTAGDAATNDQFGISVGITSDTVVVGADQKNSFAGAAYIFERTQCGAENWGQVQKLTAGDAAANDDFGVSVGIDGDTVVVGAYQKNAATGAAYIFERNQGGVENWGQVQKLTAGDAAAFDFFGVSVGISSETVAVGDDG